MIRDYFQRLLKENKITEAIDQAITLCNYTQDRDTLHDLIILSSRLSSIEQSENRGVVDRKEYNIQMNAIRDAALATISKIITTVEQNNTQLQGFHQYYKNRIHQIHNMGEIIVDYSHVLKRGSFVSYSADPVKTLAMLTNEIYFNLQDRIAPYSYGKEWLLTNSLDNSIISSDLFTKTIPDFLSEYMPNGKGMLIVKIISNKEKKTRLWDWLLGISR